MLAVPCGTNEHCSCRATACPSTVTHADAAANAGFAALLGAAVASGDAELLRAAFDDRLHEQYRAADAPLLGAIRASATDGAVGVTLSGSGPSVVVWAEHDRAEDVAERLRQPLSRRHQGAPAAGCPERSQARMSLYGKTHPAKRNSAALTDGVDRAPARAMLKGVGFTDADLAKPLIGVATTWIETMPCNLNQRVLARLREAGDPRRRAARRSSSTRSPSPTA